MIVHQAVKVTQSNLLALSVFEPRFEVEDEFLSLTRGRNNHAPKY